MLHLVFPFVGRPGSVLLERATFTWETKDVPLCLWGRKKCNGVDRWQYFDGLKLSVQCTACTTGHHTEASRKPRAPRRKAGVVAKTAYNTVYILLNLTVHTTCPTATTGNPTAAAPPVPSVPTAAAAATSPRATDTVPNSDHHRSFPHGEHEFVGATSMLRLFPSMSFHLFM